MLHEDSSPQSVSIKNAKQEIKELQKRFSVLQQKIKDAKIPVIILIDGWSASGKGTIISQISSQLEARGYNVYSSAKAEEGEARRPYLWRFWRDIPATGEITVFERGWYRQALEEMLSHSKNKDSTIDSINNFERQLSDDGHVVLKFFLNIDKDTQKKRLDDLASEKETSWRVTSDDWRQNAQYNTIKQVREDLMEITNKNNAPWHIIWNEDKNSGTCIILRTICEHLEKVLEEGVPKSKENKSKFPIIEMPKLADIDMNIPKNDGDYEKLLKKEREKLQKLHSIIYREKIPVVICFEGWDAAGKGGAIRRLSWALDPRGFKVNSIAAPTAEELAHHYLWRFWTKVPKDGHVSVFDRSWYGRVMVEKIEGFTSPDRCEMAYDEINEFEQELSKWGAVIMKFWVNIDSETQLERFTLRQETPEKQHKITDEDWRNRSKWTEYESAVDEMIKRTSTYYAPWVIIEGNDKKFARLKVLKTVRKELERRLGK